MIGKNFHFSLISRIVIMSLLMFVFFYVINNYPGYTMIRIVLFILILTQIILIIKLIGKINRNLTTFLESIRYSEFTRSFQVEGLGSSFDELKNAFNSVMQDFQKLRSEKEEQYYYLQNVIQHIGISLIAFQKDGNIEMVNNSAKRLFQVNKLKNINSLRSISIELSEKLLSIKSGENALIRITIEESLLQLAIYATEFKIRNKIITLVSIQNIQSELEEQEMVAWQKLIRVLTHEIMNSITPISSLSATVSNMIDHTEIEYAECLPEEFKTETLHDIKQALNTIHRRSDGLIHFVETYRNLTKVPKPNFSIFRVNSLFKNIKGLMEKEFLEKNIQAEFSVDPDSLDITADEGLIEQVLINLIKNSVYALENQGNGLIKVRSFFNSRGKIVIQVIDNGPGILEDVLDKIFIPFFTTKKTGSGIGLSLAKQIMRLHGGSITAQSKIDRETIFTLTF